MASLHSADFETRPKIQAQNLIAAQTLHLFFVYSKNNKIPRQRRTNCKQKTCTKARIVLLLLCAGFKMSLLA